MERDIYEWSKKQNEQHTNSEQREQPKTMNVVNDEIHVEWCLVLYVRLVVIG